MFAHVHECGIRIVESNLEGGVREVCNVFVLGLCEEIGEGLVRWTNNIEAISCSVSRFLESIFRNWDLEHVLMIKASLISQISQSLRDIRSCK